MIPAAHITAWAHIAPWAEMGQIEQDLIISRAIIDIFSDDYLRKELRFRGGTALNKLHFPEALRYSEDIDLVRTSHGPIRDILDGIRRALDWLGEASFKQSQISPKLIYKIDPEHDGPRLKLKVEINTRETEAFGGLHEIGHAIENPWFSGGVSIPTFTPEEMLATKLRALLQRDKGRDLFDLSQAMSVLESVDLERTVELFGKYLEQSELRITRANAEERMWAKLENPGFLSDIKPLLSADAASQLTDEATMEAYTRVLTEVIALIPGKSWARTPEMADRFGVQIDNNS